MPWPPSSPYSNLPLNFPLCSHTEALDSYTASFSCSKTLQCFSTTLSIKPNLLVSLPLPGIYPTLTSPGSFLIPVFFPVTFPHPTILTPSSEKVPTHCTPGLQAFFPDSKSGTAFPHFPQQPFLVKSEPSFGSLRHFSPWEASPSITFQMPSCASPLHKSGITSVCLTTVSPTLGNQHNQQSNVLTGKWKQRLSQ